MKEVKLLNNSLVVKFYSLTTQEFNDTLTSVKACKGIYNPSNKSWTVKNTQENRAILEKEFTLPSEVYIEKPIYKKTYILPHEYNEFLPSTIHNYQKEGIAFLLANNGNGLIADEPGLGKTLQAILYCHITGKKALVVCPSCVKINWQREIKKWTGKDSQIINGRYKEGYKITNDYQFTIMNYDLLPYWNLAIIYSMYQFDTLIVDECQYISNRSKRSNEIKVLSLWGNQKPSMIFLSGTPIKNRPSEFFNVLNLLDDTTFNNYYKYLHRYCNPVYNGFGWTFKGATNIEELTEKIQPLMIRRKKMDVLTELPPKQKIIVPMETDKKYFEAYLNKVDEISNWYNRLNERDKKNEVKNKLEQLKQLAYLSKRKQALEWIDNLLETTEEKIVIFAYHTNSIKDLVKHYPECVFIDGSISSEERQIAIDKFQNDSECKVFIGQIDASGTGITLAASSKAVFLEFAWNPATHEQAEDRIHRLTQEADNVTVYYLIAQDTIEEDLADMIDTKSKIVYNILDGKEKTFFEEGKSFVDCFEEKLKRGTR